MFKGRTYKVKNFPDFAKAEKSDRKSTFQEFSENVLKELRNAQK